MENDAYLCDLQPIVSPVSYVGRNLTRILDDLHRLSGQCKGKILVTSTSGQPARVQVQRSLVEQMYDVYGQLRGFNFSVSLVSLLNEFASTLAMSTAKQELTLNAATLNMIISVNNDIALAIGRVWSSVPPLRLLNASGCNADVTIVGGDGILTRMIRKLPGEARVELVRLAQVSGQFAGLRTVRQKEILTLFSDQLFSRGSSSVDLSRIFTQMSKQTNVLTEFKTDYLMTPLSRYHDLGRPVFIKVTLTATKSGGNTILTAPQIDGELLFTFINTSDVEQTITIEGKGTSSTLKIHGYAEERRFGLKVTIPTGGAGLIVRSTADLRTSTLPGQRSLIELGIDGELGKVENAELSRWFYQLMNPILPYLPGITSMLTQSQLFQTVGRAISPDVSKFLLTLKSSFYENLLSTVSTPEGRRERILTAYVLILLVPEYLLNPVITLRGTNETPPFMSSYGSLVDHFRQVYE